MVRAKNMADNVAKSLVLAIKAHRHHVGIYPAMIFAELDAYYALINENPMHLVTEHDRKFYGIPLVPLSKEGLGIYLSNGPVEILDFHDPDVKLILPSRDNDERA